MNDFLFRFRFPFFLFVKKRYSSPFPKQAFDSRSHFLKAGCFMNYKVTLVLIQIDLEIHLKK